MTNIPKMQAISPVLLVLCFAAGFISVLSVHQGLWAILLGSGVVPATAYTAWSWSPVPPWGVPEVLSKAFWGGIWGIALGALLRDRSGRSYWLRWAVLGALAPTLVSLFVVTPLKDLPVWEKLPARFVVLCVVNSVFGLGTGLLLVLFRTALGSRASAAQLPDRN